MIAYADEVALPSIEVRAEKIQENAASSLNTSDTTTLLENEPGVSLYRAGGVSSLPVIHGLADDRIRIKVDGMDLIASCPNHMNPPLSYIDPSNVENIKVFAGITPVSVGGDSIAGTILVNSASPEFAKDGQDLLIKGQIGTFYRSNNDARGGNISVTYATESLNVNYSGAISKADNYSAGSNFKRSVVTGRIGNTLGLDEVGSTAYETQNHTLGFAVKSGIHLMEAKLGYQNMPEQLYPNQRMDLLNNEQKRINLRYLGDLDWGKLEARAYHEKVDHFMDFGADKRYWYGGASGGNTGVGGSGNGQPCSPISATCAAGMPMYSEGKTTGASIKVDIKLTQQDVLRLGTELQQYRLDDWWTPSGAMMFPGTFTNINNGERDRTALFAEWEKRLSRQWMTQAGVRYEHVKTDAGHVTGYANTNMMSSNQLRDSVAFNAKSHDKTDNNWDLTALARYTRDTSMDVDFGFARKVRSPNLYERYTWSTWQMAALMNNTVGDGNGYFGNVDLKPEKAHTLSATFDWHATDREWEFKATPFYTYVTDYIDAVQWNSTTNTARTTLLKDQFTVLRYTNQSARLYGLNLSGRMPLAQTGAGLFAVKGLLNYTRGENRDTGDDLYNIMPLNTKLTLTHNYDRWDSALELQMVKTKNNVSDTRNEIKTPGYSLVNLRSSYNWKQARLDFGIENLFDKAYNLPLGGAYVGQGTTMTTALVPTGSVPLWGTAVPGMGRSVNVGLTIKY
ncbi:MAG: TonB-dependent receptor [Methylotenera sp.]|uniref:TonB-dependent receptor n=1 Tax=Methylotenera sp. TaxID=2051956 RepID=UPI002730236C|nr:TonB-dependent receptor [Methylotenera sp.]MDP1522125.1 TonB-dependent receptor [Methylotenera sp.]